MTPPRWSLALLLATALGAAGCSGSAGGGSVGDDNNEIPTPSGTQQPTVQVPSPQVTATG